MGENFGFLVQNLVFLCNAAGPHIGPRGCVGAGTPPEKPQEDGQKIQNFHPKFPPESFGTLIDRCALKNWSWKWWSHADSMESNFVLSQKTLRKVLGCQRDPSPLIKEPPTLPKRGVWGKWRHIALWDIVGSSFEGAPALPKRGL